LNVKASVPLFTARALRARRLLLWALLLSLAIHFVGGSLWAALAHALRRPAPRDVAAQTERITIERVPTPSPTPRPSPTPQPSPTPRPSPTPTPFGYRPRSAPHFIARVVAPLPKVTRPLHVTPPTLSRRAELGRPRSASLAHATLDPQQLAALSNAFQQTITQANGSLRANGQGDANGSGTDEYQGLCYDDAPPLTVNGITRHYLTCHKIYQDGFTEMVTFPWPFHFRADRDPLVTGGHFPDQGPPAGYVLPPDVKLTRAVCAFLPAQCSRRREQQAASTAGASPAP
jgi:hypothetical protein